MPEDMHNWIPKHIHERAQKTWPGVLASAIDRMLYDRVDVPVKQSYETPKMQLPAKVFRGLSSMPDTSAYLNGARVLVAVRDYLEAVALRGAMDGQFGSAEFWMSPKHEKFIEWKDEQAKEI